MEQRCRLCEKPTSFAFEKLVQGKVPVGYHRCSGCGSLQTDPPTWLEAAYRDYPGYGTDGAQRAIYMQARVLFAARVFSLHPHDTSVLDFGGGSGLIARFMRDVGFDAHVYDPFAPNVYAASFDGNPAEPWDIVTAFEVLEHLAEPRREIAQLFAPRPRIVIASTWLYHDEGSDWPYLHHESGQHVFFWSEAAVATVARLHGYDSFADGNFVLFSREPISAAQRALLRTHYVSVRLLSAAIPLLFRGARYAILDEYNGRSLPTRDPRRKHSTQSHSRT